MPRNEHDEQWQREYDREHFQLVACKVTKAEAQAFRRACAERGTTMNAVLKKAIVEYIGQAKGSE